MPPVLKFLDDFVIKCFGYNNCFGLKTLDYKPVRVNNSNIVLANRKLQYCT
jgi:hypothetical protein